MNSMLKGEKRVSCAYCRQLTAEGTKNEIKALKNLIEKKISADACNQLAIMYCSGDGVEKNPEKELELRIQAAEMGHAHGFGIIGLMYRSTCTEEFFPRYRAFLEIACKKGDVHFRESLAKWGGR